MRKSIIKVLSIAAFVLLFPTILTLIMNSGSMGKVHTAVSSGRSIIVDGENIDMEDYIPCILMGQLDISTNEEVLKAQAIVLRTYILKMMGKNNTIEGKTLNLPYTSYKKLEKTWGDDFEVNYNKIMKIMENTALQVIKYKDELIVPYFHAISAGETRDGTEVLNISSEANGNEGESSEDKEKYAYLKSVECADDLKAENYLTSQIFTKKEMIEKLKESNEDLEISEDTLISGIQIIKKCSAGYVCQIQIGNIIFDGEEFANIMGISSSCFEINEYDGNVRIVCKGSGHGLGMSINEAIAYSETGKSYTDILKYFYSDIEIE